MTSSSPFESAHQATCLSHYDCDYSGGKLHLQRKSKQTNRLLHRRLHSCQCGMQPPLHVHCHRTPPSHITQSYTLVMNTHTHVPVHLCTPAPTHPCTWTPTPTNPQTPTLHTRTHPSRPRTHAPRTHAHAACTQTHVHARTHVDKLGESVLSGGDALWLNQAHHPPPH